MVSETVRGFQPKHTDLVDPRDHVAAHLRSKGVTALTSPTGLRGTVIQATRIGLMGGLDDVNRAVTVQIAVEPDNFIARMGMGKWLEHLATSPVENLLLVALFLVVDVEGRLRLDLQVVHRLNKSAIQWVR